MNDPAHEPDAAFAARHRDATNDEGRRLRRGLISLIVLVILAGALVVAVPGLHHVADRIKEVNPWWLVLAVVLELGSCVGYVLAFQLIFSRVPRRLATRVALSEMAFGAVLPVGGAGGIAVGAWVTRAKGGSLRRFMERSSVLFLVTSAINGITLAGAGLLVGVGILHAPHPLLLGLVPGLAGCAIVLGFCLIPVVAGRFAETDDDGRAVRWLRITGGVVRSAMDEARDPRPRLVGAVMYLWCDIAMLWVCFRAFGQPPAVGALVLAFIIGYLGNVIPIPGGIGALDGGLTGALILYGAEPASATAAVLVYHAIVLWLPTVLGSIAFLRLRSTIDEPLVLRAERGADR